MRTAHFDDDGRGPVAYQDYGPAHPTRGTWKGTSVYTSTWINRPFCDLCGPWRGRYLRPIGNGEHRCRSCDNE